MTRRFPTLISPIKLLVLAALISAQGTVLSVSTARASEAAMLIFDASRSMRGKIEGKTRINIARDVLGKVFQRYEASLKLGIMAYGSRSSSNCRDIRYIRPVGRIRPASYKWAIKRIRPRGKTPIALAIRAGANRLDYKNKKTTLILMSDGLDNCKGNPCAVARKLEETANFLTIHVIAFSVPKEDLPGLTCIARNSGGKFFTAANGTELGVAFDKIVAEISDTDLPDIVIASSRNTAEQDKLDAVKADADVETRKLLEAMRERARQNAEIENLNPSEGRTTRTIGAGKTITIEPSNTSDVTDAVLENPMKPDILLMTKDTKEGSEGLGLVARLAADSPPLERNIKWEIYNFLKSSDGNRSQILTSEVAQPTLPLSPGKYIVRAVFGVSSTAKVITISPAQITDATFVLNTGGIRVKPLLVAGEPPAGKRPQQWIYLSPAPGSTSAPQLVATANDPNEIHQLTAGTYELISKFGSANAVVKTNVTISPGLLTEVEVSHKAGIVQFKLFKKWRGGEELTGASWKLFDDEGNEVVSDLAAGSGEIIAPGRYKVTALYNENIYTKTFNIRPGKKKLIQVVVK